MVGTLESFFWRYPGGIRGHRCHSHSLGWHVYKHLLPFQQFCLDRLPRCASPHMELASCYCCRLCLSQWRFVWWFILWEITSVALRVLWDIWLHSLRPHRDKHQVPSKNHDQNRNSSLLVNPFHSPHFLCGVSGLSGTHKLMLSISISSCCPTYLSGPTDSYLKGLSKMCFLQFVRIHISLPQWFGEKILVSLKITVILSMFLACI